MLEIQDLLATFLEAGAFSAQLGDVETEAVIGLDADVWGPAGLASRPSKPDPDNNEAAQALVLKTGTRDAVIGMKDTRNAAIFGNVKEGETCLYASGPQGEGTGRVLMKDSGDTASITLLLQKDNDSSGLPIVLQLKSDNSLNIALTDKVAVNMSADGINMTATDGTLSSAFSITPAEINLVSTKINLHGQGVLLGPNPTAATPCTVGPVGMSAVGSSCVLVSP